MALENLTREGTAMTADKTDEQITEDYEVLHQAVAVVCDRLRGPAVQLAASSGRAVSSCLATLLRPMIVNYLDTGEAVNMNKERDHRTRNWDVRILLWNISHGEEEGEILFSTPTPERIRGLRSVGERIREVAAETHGLGTASSVREFTAQSMVKRMGGMHPAIVRGQGKATTRIRYLVDETPYICQVDISRA